MSKMNIRKNNQADNSKEDQNICNNNEKCGACKKQIDDPKDFACGGQYKQNVKDFF